MFIISENRPEWFISDLSIMLSQSITVPTYTTYMLKKITNTLLMIANHQL